MQVYLIKKILYFLAYLGISVGISAFIFVSQMVFISIIYSMIMYLYPNVSSTAVQDDILSEESEDTFDILYSLIEGAVICCVMFGNLTCKSVGMIFKLQILVYFLTLALNLSGVLTGSKGKYTIGISLLINLTNLVIIGLACNVLFYNQQIPAVMILCGYVMQVGIGFSRMLKST